MDWQIICGHIEQTTGTPFRFVSARSIAGGDINSAFCLQGEQQRYFVKSNHRHLAAMFAAEFAGLEALANTQTVRVPKPLLDGVSDESAYLVMELINLTGMNKSSEHRFGLQLAELHRLPQTHFGWHRDNTIGSTAQINTPNDDWLSFWRQHRLGYQLELAKKNGYGKHLQTLGERLLADMAGFFVDYQPMPSLLHGDLWAGNAASDTNGQPVMFDPATYVGDREADIAMTELFGGFGKDFYAAYQDAYPLDKGYAVRKTFYNLYHILNHVNLFGSSYVPRAVSMMSQLLAELR